MPLALLLVQFFKGQSVDIVSFPQAQLQLTGKSMTHFLTKMKPLKVRKVTFQSVLGAPAKVKRRQELRAAERKSAHVYSFCVLSCFADQALDFSVGSCLSYNSSSK